MSLAARPTTCLRRRRASHAAAALTLTLLLAGCSDSDGAPGEGAADPSTSASTSPTASESPAAADVTPAVAPAAGAPLKIEGVRLRAPVVWSDVPDRFAFRQAAFAPFTKSYVSVYRFPNSGLFTLDELGDESVKDTNWAPRARRLEDLVVDDQPVFHIVGPQTDGTYREDFGTILDDTQLLVSFVFAEDEPAAYRDDVIASVLATVDFGARSVALPAAGSVPPAPARGPFITIPGARLRIPVYWDKTDFPLPTLDGAFPRGVLGTSVALSSSPQGGTTDLDQVGDASVRGKGWRSRATRLDDVVIDDQPAVHVAGEVNPGEYVDQFVMLLDGQRLAVTFTFAGDESPAYRDEVVASVVPTIRLTD